MIMFDFGGYSGNGNKGEMILFVTFEAFFSAF